MVLNNRFIIYRETEKILKIIKLLEKKLKRLYCQNNKIYKMLSSKFLN